jgi:hypothetical protein
VSGLIAKTSGIAKTEFQKNDRAEKSGAAWGAEQAGGGSGGLRPGGRPQRRFEKPFGAQGLRWYALSNETNDDTSGMRRPWRLARCSG